jgi:signal peptidase
MRTGDLLKYGVTSVFIVLILTLIVTQLLGQPAIIFVESGSMEPTLEPNDGFVAVPSLFAGDVEEGDVILFEAQRIGGGGPTTHRVVGETENGYITRGDANPFTDQDGGEPPVTEGQIKSVGVQVNGELVVIPGLGATVGAITDVTQTVQERLFTTLGLAAPGVPAFSTGILVIGLLMLVYSLVAGSVDERKRTRSSGGLLRNGVVIVAILTLVVIIPVNFSMLLPSGVYQYDIVSSQSPTEGPQVIQAGGSAEVTYFMRNSGHLPVLVFLEPASPGVDIPDDRTRTFVPPRSTVNASVTLQAPRETGVYPRFVREHRYLVVMPPSLITALHRVHPFLALAGINLFVASVVVVVGVTSIGTGRVRLRSRARDLPLRAELARHVPALGARTATKSNSSSRRRGRSRAGENGRTRPPAPTPGEGSGRTRSPDRDGLTDRQRSEVAATLQRSPSAVGLDAPRWTPALVQTYVEDTYDVECSLVRSMWLLNRAGIDPDRGGE